MRKDHDVDVGDRWLWAICVAVALTIMLVGAAVRFPSATIAAHL